MSVTIDSTYAALVARLPAELRGPARGLLFELGLARVPGRGWADVFQLPPSRDLPRFTVRSGHEAPDAHGLAAFLRVHHAACFHHVLVDRLADRQAPVTPERERLAAHFLAFWREALAEAHGGGLHYSHQPHELSSQDLAAPPPASTLPTVFTLTLPEVTP